MKKKIVLTVAALAILLSCGIAFTAEKEKGKAKAQRQKMTAEEKAWKEKLAAMTPEQRKLAMAKRALEMDLAPWREVRKIAEGEKAAKTVAAIDKIIATKEQQFKKKLEAAEKKKTGATNKTPRKRAEGAKEGGRRGRAKVEDENK
jgi:hypothetical protein